MLVNAIPLVQFAVQYIRLGTVQKSTPSATISSVVSLILFGTQPTGELILLSVYACVPSLPTLCGVLCGLAAVWAFLR